MSSQVSVYLALGCVSRPEEEDSLLSDLSDLPYTSSEDIEVAMSSYIS